jgi:hypothetical protein
LELDLRRDCNAAPLFGAEIEEVLRAETEGLGEEGRRHALALAVIFLRRIVVEAPRRGDLVLEIVELVLELQEILVGLELGISAALSMPSAWPCWAGPWAVIAALRACATSSKMPFS